MGNHGLIGLLVCDHARKELNHPDGSYPEMFRRILPGFNFVDYYVCDGIFPESTDECDGWIISGSRFSVYDEIDWIIRLKHFTRDIATSGKPCIGVCFGHQMICEAMGGSVKKAPTGWCAGVHAFDIHLKKSWMAPDQQRANLLMMCQDQVMELPPDTSVIASSPQCRNAMILVGSNMLGIQGHPEFSVDYEEKLILVNAKEMGLKTALGAIASLSCEVHSGVVAGWMRQFFGLTIDD